jgi:hypothetical protein
MAGRGRDWSLLNGEDPTPGDVGAVEAAASAVRTHAGAAEDAAAGTSGFTAAVGGSGWSGTAAEGFVSAFTPTARLVADTGTALEDGADALEAWGAELQGMQDAADRLLDEARRVKAELEQARRDLADAQESMRMASAAIAAAEPGQGFGAIRAYDEASMRAHRAQEDIERLEQEWADLRRDAADLADEHRTAVVSAAAALGGAAPDAVTLLPFRLSVTAQQLAAALPDLDVDADGDGLVDASELAAAVLEIQGGLLDPDHDLSEEALRLYADLLTGLSADPEAAADVVAALGDDTAHVLLLLQELGRHVGAERYAGVADGLLALIGAASNDPEGREVLRRLVEGDRVGDLLLLIAHAPDLEASLVARIAERVMFDDELLAGMPMRNAFFDAGSGHLEAVLRALGANPEAMRQFLEGGEGRLDHLLGYVDSLELYDPEPLALALAAAIEGADDPAAIAARVIAATGDSDGFGWGNAALVEAVAPHLVELTSHPELMSAGGSTAEALRKFWQVTLDGMSPQELATAYDQVLAGVRDSVAGFPDHWDGTDVTPIADDIIEGISPLLSPFVQAVTENVSEAIGDHEDARDAIEGLLGDVAGAVPVPGVGKVGEVVVGALIEQAAQAAAGGIAGDAPTYDDQLAARIADALQPVVESEIRQAGEVSAQMADDIAQNVAREVAQDLLISVADAKHG